MGAKLASFEQGMDEAVSIADRAVSDIENRFKALNPSVSSNLLAAGVLGAVGAFGSLLAFAKQVNSELAEMGRTARQVGLSVEKFQALRFAGAVGGVDGGAFAEGLQQTTALLNDAQRNTNSLTRLFEANGIAIRQNNGQLISTNQLLNETANLMARAASEQDKIKIASMVGLTRDWVPLLEQGADALQRTAAEAQSAGVIIDAETIEKAKRFDEEWTKAGAVMSAQLRAAAADAGVLISELIDRASSFVEALAAANGGGGDLGQQKFSAIADAIDIVRKNALGLTQDYDQVTRALERYQAKATADPGVIESLQAIQAAAKAAADELARAAQARSALLSAVSENEFPGGVPLPRARPAAAQQPPAVVPARETDQGAGRDPFQASIDSANRRIAVLNAETATIGLNSEARERARLVATLEEAAKRANTAAGLENTAVTAEQRTQIEQLATAMESAARQNRLLSEAMAGMRELGSAGAEALKGLAIEGKEADEVLSQLLNRLASRAIDQAFNSLLNALGGSLFGGGGGLAGLVGGGSGRLFSFGGGRAGGGQVTPGNIYRVNENTPNSEWFAPNVPGQIIPNDVMQRSLRGGTSISFGDTIVNGSGLTEEQLARAIAASQVQVLRQVPGMALKAVADQRLRG